MNIGMNLKSNKRNEEVLNIVNVFINFVFIKYLFCSLLDLQKNLIMLGCIHKKQ